MVAGIVVRVKSVRNDAMSRMEQAAFSLHDINKGKDI